MQRFMFFACIFVLATTLEFTAAQTASAPAGTKIYPPSAVDVARRSIDLSIENTSFDKAIFTLAKQSGGRFAIDWKSLAAVGITGGSKASVQGEKLPVAKALDMLLASLKDAKIPLGWTIYSDTFVITTQAQILRYQQFSAAMREMGRSPEEVTAKPAAASGASAGPATAAQGAKAQPISAAALWTRRLDIDFKDTSFEDVVAYIKEKTGMNVVVNWRALEMVGVDKTARISLKVSNITMPQAMELIFSQFNAGKSPLEKVYWDYREGILSITTGSVLNERMESRVYDVNDLLLVVPNFAAPTMGGGSAIGNPGAGGQNSWGGGSGGNFAGSSGSAAGSSNYSTGGYSGSGSAGSTMGAMTQNQGFGQTGVQGSSDQESILISIVQNMIGPDFWAPAGKGTIRIFKGQMIITQSRLGFLLLDRGF